MKEQNEIDQLFEQQLGNLSIEPSAASWENISSSLDGNVVSGSDAASVSKKRYFVYALIGTVAAFLAYFLMFNQGKNSDLRSNSSPIVETQQQNTNSDNKLRKVNTTDLSSIEEDSPLKAEVNRTTQKSSEKSSPSNISNNNLEKEAVKQEVSHSTDYISQKKFEKAKSEKSALVTTVALSSSELEAFTEPVKKEESVTEPGSFKEEKGVNKESVNSTASVDEHAVIPVAVNTTVQSTTVQPKIETQQAENTEQASIEKETNEVQEENVQSIEEMEEGPDANVNSPSPSEVSGIHYATAWSIDAYGGPSFIKSDEQIVHQEGDAIHQTGIDQQIITPNIGLNVKYHINNWFIQSGIAYAEYGENRSYIENIEMHDTSGFSKQDINEYYTYDTTGWIPDPNNSGVLIPLFDAVYHSDTSYNWISQDSLYYEHQKIYSQNRFRYIEIPAMIGYEFRFKNLGVEVATGVSLGFRVNSSGKFLDSQNNLVDINPSNSPYSNTMMNYILTVGLKYHMGSRFSIIAQPIYKTNLNSLIKTGSGSDIRYSSFGVNVGVNYIIK